MSIRFIKRQLAACLVVASAAWTSGSVMAKDPAAAKAAQESAARASQAVYHSLEPLMASLPFASSLKKAIYERCPEGTQRFWKLLANEPMPRIGESRYGWEWLAARHGKNASAGLSRAEFSGPPAFFDRLDRNCDGVLTRADFDWSDHSPLVQKAAQASQLLGRMDGDSNGRISAADWAEFFAKAAKDKGYLTHDDLQELNSASRRTTLARGNSSDQQLQSIMAVFRRGSFRWDAPPVDAEAPDFQLRTADEKTQVRLSQFRGRQPVVLVFGSLTCPPYRQQTAVLEDMHRRYADQAQFLSIYIREAHTIDEWRTPANDRIGLNVVQPVEIGERRKMAQKFCTYLKTEMQVLVDELDDRVARTYNAMPNRLFLVDRAGCVAYRAAPGPYGLNPTELEQALILLLLDDSQSTLKQRQQSAR
jgi:Iodothyronine deiodinase